MTARAARSWTGRGMGLRNLGVAACVLALLSGCTGTPAVPTSTPTSPDSFTLATLPHLDGSTASIPLISLIMQELGDVPKVLADNVEASTTPTAYASLACGTANPKGSVVIAYEPTQLTKDAIASCTPLEFHPIGRDALVFVVNEKNPVSSLTTEQYKGIYAGEITNWKDVGGTDHKIVAYQQSASSGSQALLEKHVMGKAELAKAPAETVIGDKGVLTEGLANYDNTENAIGYSVFYYVSQLYAAPDAKVLKADGVAPSTQTISDGTYPYVNDFYAAIRADEPESSPARRIVAWLESPEGQRAIADAGYVAGATAG